MALECFGGEGRWCLDLSNFHCAPARGNNLQRRGAGWRGWLRVVDSLRAKAQQGWGDRSDLGAAEDETRRVEVLVSPISKSRGGPADHPKLGISGPIRSGMRSCAGLRPPARRWASARSRIWSGCRMNSGKCGFNPRPDSAGRCGPERSGLRASGTRIE